MYRKTLICLSLPIFLLLASLAFGQTVTCTVTLIDIYRRGNVDPVAQGINDEDKIVGAYFSQGANGLRGYIARIGTGSVGIGVFVAPGATNTWLNDIDDDEAIVGQYDLSDGTSHSFLLTGVEDLTVIDYPGSTQSGANGISNTGDIVGEYILN